MYSRATKPKDKLKQVAALCCLVFIDATSVSRERGDCVVLLSGAAGVQNGPKTSVLRPFMASDMGCVGHVHART